MARVIIYRGSVKIGNGMRGPLFSFDPITNAEFQSAVVEGQQPIRVRIVGGPSFVVEIPGDGKIEDRGGEKSIKDPTDPDGTQYMNAQSIVTRAKQSEDGFRVIA